MLRWDPSCSPPSPDSMTCSMNPNYHCTSQGKLNVPEDACYERFLKHDPEKREKGATQHPS